MGVMAEIVDILEKEKTETERATPEMVLALAVRRGEEKERGAGGKNEGKPKEGRRSENGRNEQR